MFIDTFNDLGLEQVVGVPTHQHGRTLDLVLTNKTGLIRNVSVLEQHKVCQSDHFAIQIDLNIKARKLVNKRKAYNYKKANWDGLNREINSVGWDRLLNSCEPEVGWARLKTILFKLIDRYIPTITIKDNGYPPWYDNETFALCRKKRKLRKQWKNPESPVTYETYSNCRKEYRILIEQKMKANIIDDDEDPSLISKKFWGHLKRMSSSSRIPETVYYKTRFRNNSQDQTEIFNEFFVDQFSDVSEYDIDIDFTNDPDNDIDFDFRKIRALLKHINVNKATGPDGISGKVLKNCASSLAYPLSLLFKVSYNSGMLPNDWKLANIVPVHKKNSKASVENYRPISLTCLVVKIFEKIIRDEIMTKCQHKLNPKQHGFLPEKSCTTQMIGFTESVALAMNENLRTDVIYFDFAKAFDSVNHDIILHKLKHEFNIDGTLLKFLVNYLQGRSQRVVIGGAMSSLVGVQSGVPQGSILGPLLFVIFINDMIHVVTHDTNIALYADDTKIWRKISCWEDHEILQNDINALHAWSVRNKMRFHPLKCKALPIAPTNKGLHSFYDEPLPFLLFYYELNGHNLDFVESEKDLGVIINCNFTWSDQQRTLYAKACSRLGLLKRTLHFVKCEKQKRSFYLAIVRSQFEHCVQIWRPTTTSSINVLERVQKRAVKWILSEEDFHYNDMEYMTKLKQLDLLPLEYRFLFSDLIMFYKIYNDVSCIKLPEYYTPIANEDRVRLRATIKPPNYLSANRQTINLENLRSTKFDKTSLKCDINSQATCYKNNFFFRTVQHWNRVPVEIRSQVSFDGFKESLRAHLIKQAFELEPD